MDTSQTKFSLFSFLFFFLNKNKTFIFVFNFDSKLQHFVFNFDVCVCCSLLILNQVIIYTNDDLFAKP